MSGLNSECGTEMMQIKVAKKKLHLINSEKMNPYKN